MATHFPGWDHHLAGDAFRDYFSVSPREISCSPTKSLISLWTSCAAEKVSFNSLMTFSKLFSASPREAKKSSIISWKMKEVLFRTFLSSSSKIILYPHGFAPPAEINFFYFHLFLTSFLSFCLYYIIVIKKSQPQHLWLHGGIKIDGLV